MTALPQVHEMLGSRCMYWYITSTGEKIGEFKPQEIGTVVWEDSNGKETITEFVGQMCGQSSSEPESPDPVRDDGPRKLTINKKITLP